MSLANSFDEFKREIELIIKQNPLECELYSIVASIIRERDSSKNISLRDVSNIKSFYNHQNQKDRMYRINNGEFGASDFLIMDSNYYYSGSCENKILGSIEVKAIYLELDSEINNKKEQFYGELQAFKKLIYTNGLVWRLYEYNSNLRKEKLLWEIKLGEYSLYNKCSNQISCNDKINWENVKEWYKLLTNLEEIHWKETICKVNNIDIELIWKRIIENEGKDFKQKGGKIFTYNLIGENTIKLNTTNRIISKSQFEKALNFVPLDKLEPIQNLQAPSYIYGILMDDRVRKENW